MRVTSEKTRQAILAVEGQIDPDFPPDRLVLFDSNGNPISFEGAHGVPPGGTEGQLLGKTGDEDFAYGWVDTGGGAMVPAGGTTGQVLTKVSDTDGDAGWADPSAGAQIVTSKRFFLSLDNSVGSLINVDGGAHFQDVAVFGSAPGMAWGTTGDNVSYSTKEAFHDFDAQIKFTTSSPVPTGQASWSMIRRISTTKQLAFFTDFFNGIFLFKGVPSGTWSSLASAPMSGYTVQPNKDYWFRARMDGAGNITVGLYEENPRVNPLATPVKSFSYALTSTDLTDFGPSKVGYPGLRLVGHAAAANANVRMQDYEINEYVQTLGSVAVIDSEEVEVAPPTIDDPSPIFVYDMTDSSVISENFSFINDGMNVRLLATNRMNQRIILKFTWTTGSNAGILLRAADTGDLFLMGSLLEDGLIHIHERLPTEFTDRGSTSAAAISGTTYWLEFTAIGRDVLLRLFTVAPGPNIAPVKMLQYTLQSDSKLLYRGRPGVRHDEAALAQFTYEKI